MRSISKYNFSGLANARDCGTVWAKVQLADRGYIGEFSGYNVFFQQSD